MLGPSLTQLSDPTAMWTLQTSPSELVAMTIVSTLMVIGPAAVSWFYGLNFKDSDLSRQKLGRERIRPATSDRPRLRVDRGRRAGLRIPFRWKRSS